MHTEGGLLMSNVISVQDYLNAYRPAYEAVKADGSRKRGEKAYENLFAVAQRTDDMQQAQLIIEEEGLMLKLTTEDALDIHEKTLAKLDPLDEVTTVLTNLNIDLYSQAQSTEDITYRSHLLDLQTIEGTAKGKMKMLLAATLADQLIKYDQAKRMVRFWPDNGKAKAGVAAMAKLRRIIRATVAIIETEFEKDWAAMMDEQFFMIQMLAPQNLDEYGCKKKSMHPDTMAAYRDMMTEIMSDDTLFDILMKEQPHCMCYYPE